MSSLAGITEEVEEGQGSRRMIIGNPLQIHFEGAIHMTGAEHWTSMTRSSSSASSSRLRMSEKVASTDCLTIDQDLRFKEKAHEKVRVSVGNFDIIGIRNRTHGGPPPGPPGSRLMVLIKDELKLTLQRNWPTHSKRPQAPGPVQSSPPSSNSRGAVAAVRLPASTIPAIHPMLCRGRPFAQADPTGASTR